MGIGHAVMFHAVAASVINVTTTDYIKTTQYT